MVVNGRVSEVMGNAASGRRGQPSEQQERGGKRLEGNWISFESRECLFIAKRRTVMSSSDSMDEEELYFF